MIKLKTESRSCKSFVGASITYSEITGPYQFLLQMIRNIAFLRQLHPIFCYKNKKILKLWQEVRFFNYLIRGISGSNSLTINLKMIKLETEIGSFRSSFCSSFSSLEITPPYLFLLKII